MKVPQHLQDPEPGVKTYGRINRHDRGSGPPKYVVQAEPQVLELAKRLFPGSDYDGTNIMFTATARAIENLNWLMLRFPLEIPDRETYGRDKEAAIALAARRAGANNGIVPASPPPEFRGTLYPYQAEDVAKMIAAGRMLNANQTGLGKTTESLAAIATANAYPALVVVPAQIIGQWQDMMETFLALTPGGELPLDTFVSASRMCAELKGQTPYRLPDRPLYITHYGLLKYWRDVIESLGIKAVTFDEVQELRRTESMKYTAATAIAETAKYVWGLSATPVYNYGNEMWSVMNALDYYCLGDSMSFSREWCGGWGKQVREPEKLGQYLVAESLLIRRRKRDKDVKMQLPPKHRLIVEIDHDESLYRHMAEKAIALSKSYDGLAWKDRGTAVRQIATESRQAAGASKAPYVAAWVKALIDAGERPLIFAHHHVVHDEITKALEGKGLVRLTGHENPKRKQEARRDFIEGRANAALLALRAATGYDGFQRRATCAVFAELDWSPAIHGQCEDRIWRPGFAGQDSLPIYYLTARNSYDQIVRDILGLKVQQATGVMLDDPMDDWDLQPTGADDHMKRLIERLAS